MKTSKWFIKHSETSVKCTLCPHECIIREGNSGSCRVRSNQGGLLRPDNYGLISALRTDPIEKKPLYHFYPGSGIFSVGSAGCNLRCVFCQNCEISQVISLDDILGLQHYEPQQIVDNARTVAGNLGIAFTYNEPTVWYDFMFDTARLAKSIGLKTVMVTNGYINRAPLSELLEVTDAFSVDLKGFTEEFYHKASSARLEPVKESIKQIAAAKRHFEIVNLVIPGMNDNRQTFNEMVKWISGELGKETVLHLSKYFPMYKLNTPATSTALLEELHEMASQYLDYVYLGNTESHHNNTYCPQCKSLVIVRHGYNTVLTGIDASGNCSKCRTKILKYI